MAQGQLRSFLSLIALISLIGGTFATALGLIKIGDDPSGKFMSDEEYIVPAAVGNTLCVVFLIWLTATIPTRSTAYKLIVIVFLILGLIGEIYLTFFFTQPPAVYGTYFIVVLNFLIRTFYVLEYVQDTWNPISWNDYVGAPKPSSSSPSRPSGESKPAADSSESKDYKSDPKYKETKDKLHAAEDKMKADSRGFDGATDGKAFKALGEALKAGKSFDEAYRLAKAELKYKDGSAYTGAGRRRA
jgi:hypothetical protein